MTAGEFSSTHWLTLYDEDDGEPYGTVCWCELDEDHDEHGDPMQVTS